MQPLDSDPSYKTFSMGIKWLISPQKPQITETELGEFLAKSICSKLSLRRNVQGWILGDRARAMLGYVKWFICQRYVSQMLVNFELLL